MKEKHWGAMASGCGSEGWSRFWVWAKREA